MVVRDTNRSLKMDNYNCCSYAFNTKTGFAYPDIGLVFDYYDTYMSNDDNEHTSSWEDFVEDVIFNEFPDREEPMTRPEKADYIVDASVEALLRERKDIRVIEDESELRPNEELVEFAVELWPLMWKCDRDLTTSDHLENYLEVQNNPNHEVNRPDDYELDYDFHFKVLRNGEWQHKIGGTEISRTYSWRDTSYEAAIDNFGSMKYGVCDSKVVLLASKVKKEIDEENE